MITIRAATILTPTGLKHQRTLAVEVHAFDALDRDLHDLEFSVGL